jgi:hypothetical protein
MIDSWITVELYRFARATCASFIIKRITVVHNAGLLLIAARPSLYNRNRAIALQRVNTLIRRYTGLRHGAAWNMCNTSVCSSTTSIVNPIRWISMFLVEFNWSDCRSDADWINRIIVNISIKYWTVRRTMEILYHNRKMLSTR